MKRFILTCMVILSFSHIFAEDKIGSYSMSYFDGKQLNIKASEPKNGKFSFYIYVHGKREYDEVCFALKNENLNQFKTALSEVRDKFVEWEQTAKENNVTDIKKPFPVSFPKVDIAWKSSKWWFSFNKYMKPNFMVFKDGSCAMVVYLKVTASSNEYIDQEVYWVLQSKEEFDDILKVLDESLVIDHYNNKESATDLFK